MSPKILPQEIVRAKRDGQCLSADDIRAFVAGITDGTVASEQISALAMATFFQGMSRDEAVALTLAMRDSGTVLDWSDLDGPVVDKHSTGGVGDNVSLMLAPAVAACGVFVPMISGRGLGHTGGTLDKMEAIPGYSATPDKAVFRKVTRNVGCAIIGQTADLAPADKRFYSIRDVTATVESVPLITASILSKKLAAGLRGLVLDVKCGNGAFMDNIEQARELAKSLVEVANGAGLPTTAVLTDMNQPLARAVGNGLEVQAAIDLLTGRDVTGPLWDVTVALGAEMLVTGGVAESLDDGLAKMDKAFSSGAAAEKFARMVEMLGGPADLLERPEKHLESAPVVVPVPAPQAGGIIQMDTRGIGVAVVALGGGRTRPQDDIDPAVGLTDLPQIGDMVEEGEPLAFVHARDADSAAQAVLAVQRCCTIGSPTQVPDVMQVIERIAL